MKILRNLILVIFFLSITNFSYAENKIAYLDIDSVLEKTLIGKSIYKDLNDLNKKNIEKLKKIEKQLKNQEEDIISKKSIISSEAFNEEVSKLKLKINSFKEEKNNMVQDFSQKKKLDIKKFLNKINPIIQGYMKSNSINILLDKKNILIGSDNLDITANIIKLIDEKLK